MSNNKIAGIAILAFCLLFAVSGFAQEEIFFLGHETGTGARAMGMGGAYIGVADDYSAIYWNPAGLAQIRRMEMNLGFSHNSAENDATFLGNTDNSSVSATRLNSLGFVFPVPTYQGSMVLAVGYNRVRDFDNTLYAKGTNDDYSAFDSVVLSSWDNPYWKTDINGGLLQEQSVLEEGTLNNFSLSGAMEVQEDFYLGASLNFITGKDDYSMDFTETDENNKYNSSYFDTLGNEYINDIDTWTLRNSIVSDFSAANFKIGGMYRYNKMLRLGGTIVFPTTYTITETWEETLEESHDDYDEDPYTVGDTYEYKIQEPYVISAGASLQLLNVLLSGSLEFKDWSQAKFKSDPPIAGTSQTQMNSYIKQNLKSTTTMRLGAEFFVPVLDARLRAGYIHVPSAYKYVEEDLDKDYITLGASLMLDKQVMIDLAVIRGSSERVIDESGAGGLNLTNTVTTQDMTYSKMTGTLSIRF